MAMEYFCCFNSYRKTLSTFSDEQVGRLFKALMEWNETGEHAELSDIEMLAFEFIRSDIERSRQAYQDKVERNRRNGAKGGRPKKPTGFFENPENPTVFLETQKTQCKGKGKGKSKCKGKGEGKGEGVLLSGDLSPEEDPSALKENDTACAELRAEPASAPPAPVIEIVLNTGKMYGVCEEDVREWSELYPAVDVMQELRSMKGWCEANPARRKTERGIRGFIVAWLKRTQDKGGNNGYSRGGGWNGPSGMDRQNHGNGYSGGGFTARDEADARAAEAAARWGFD